MNLHNHESQANEPEPPAPNLIAFRLDKKYVRLLHEQAERLGVGVPDLARAYLIGLLSESEQRQNVICRIGYLCQQSPQALN